MTLSPPRKLLDVVRGVIRLRHYSYRTEQSYLDWIKQYLRYHNGKHPRDMGKAEIQAFLTHLAVEGNVAASTQNQALSALLFLYRNVLEIEIEGISEFARAKRPKRLPTVLTKSEVKAVMQHLTGVERLVIQLLYGSGLRLSEALNLRVKDVDFAQHQLIIRDTKGNEDRAEVLNHKYRRSTFRQIYPILIEKYLPLASF